MPYRIFDIAVASNIPLAGLAASSKQQADVTVVFCPGEAADVRGFNWIHQWKNAQQAVTMACARRGDEYLLRFPRLADFHVRWTDSCIRVYPQAGADASAAVQMLLDQVIPRMLFHGGRTVLHASAVVLPDGTAAAFVGDTGRGKSTLAASLYQAGARLMSDDCLLIEQNGTGVAGIPAYSGLRLWPDSFAALAFGAGQLAVGESVNGKRRLEIKNPAGADDRVALSALFLLGATDVAPRDDSIAIARVTGSSMMMALIEAAFVLDLVSPDAARRNFRLLGAIAHQDTPVFSLNFPRRHAFLPQVRAAVERLLRAARGV